MPSLPPLPYPFTQAYFLASPGTGGGDQILAASKPSGGRARSYGARPLSTPPVTQGALTRSSSGEPSIRDASSGGGSSSLPLPFDGEHIQRQLFPARGPGEGPLCSDGLFPLLPLGDHERDAAMGHRGLWPTRSSTRRGVRTGEERTSVGLHAGESYTLRK